MMTFLAIVGAVVIVLIVGAFFAHAAKEGPKIAAAIEEEKRVMSDMRRIDKGEAPIYHTWDYYQRRIRGEY